MGVLSRSIALVVIIRLILLVPIVFAVADTTQDELLYLINQERNDLGLDPVHINSLLETSSQGHSDDMVTLQYFSHTSQDGRTYINRIVNAGYTPYVAIGENIAWHNGDPNASFVFELWKNSSGHYQVMTFNRFEEIGIGISQGIYNGASATFYVTDFGKRQNGCVVNATEQRECGTSNLGECSFGTETRTCSEEGYWGNWSGCSGNVEPIAEICEDGLDNDCNGAIDDFCNCIDNVTYACYDTDLYYYDSCDRRQDVAEDCSNLGCEGSTCCTEQSSYSCYNNDIYWFDACGDRGSKKEECYTYGCNSTTNECNTCDSHASYQCYNNDVYWYNECGEREDKKQECYTDGCNNGECVKCITQSSYQCYRNDVYYYDSCGNRETRKESCDEGCSDDECIVCDSHQGYMCYNNDVYWYDSCNNREEKKEECALGCESDECIPLPCGDNDEDGFIDVECGGLDCDDTSAYINPNSTEICNDVDDDCNSIVDDSCTENLVISEPAETHIESDERRVFFELDVQQMMDSAYYSINNERWRTFCRDVDRCMKTLSLPEGNSTISFKVQDHESIIHETNMTAFVDSKKPRISRILPRTYTNGNFTAIYTEDNPERVELLISTGGFFNLAAFRTDCPGGKRKECTIAYDVTSLNGHEIGFIFNISDHSSHDESRKETVIVDSIVPNMTQLDFNVTERGIDFNITISEEATLEYYDAPRDRWRSLCRGCSAYTRSKSFRDEPATLDIRAMDKAGNYDLETISLI
ncbi:hypothetical protein H6503_05185 [Candidatus Woesearchaeota archaeon]|nr:hypothetical protein [Candidatus Woesearchaeota archaeon]